MEIASIKTKDFRSFPLSPTEIEKTGSPVKSAVVINSLNRINFHNDHVYVKFRHIWSRSFITLAAKPGPVNEAGIKLALDRNWKTLGNDISVYDYCGMFYSDGLKMIWVKANPISLNNQEIILSAPVGGHEIGGRSCRRARCLGVSTKLSQGIVRLQAKMKDFSSTAFAIELSPDRHTGVSRVNFDMPVNIVVDNGEKILFEATCRIVRALAHDHETTFVVSPVSTNIRRFKPKQNRSLRQKLTPQPCIEYLHPLLGKRISLKAIDISGSGVSVEEDPANSLLMPGMTISDMAITFANSFKINCSSQVLYTRYIEDNDSVQVGIAFTAMDGKDQLQLSSLLYQAKNEKSFVGNSIDMDDLWDFFFDTGFIYPKKYLSIEGQKETLKSLYGRLYNGSPDIARHITYRDKGIIYGHVSMFRYYSKTWLLHHHAAIRSSQHKAGLVVMDHILQHINEAHHFPDAAMKYIACYFRPNNRFASRAFGGASKSLQDPRKSSLDEFAYFHLSDRKERELPENWMMVRSSREDFEELGHFYQKISGGLMLKALDLEKSGGMDEEEINVTYREQGFKRERKFYSLKDKEGCLTALFVLNFSNAGLNMSSLTNCIQVFVIDPKVGGNLVESVLSKLGGLFEGKAPILLFPRSHADDNGIDYENIYTLGILDLNYISKFIGFMAGLTKSKLRLAKKEK